MSKIKDKVIFYSVVLVLLVFTACSQEPEYDVIIQNALILDGSGNPPYTGDLAINNDTIALIGQIEMLSAKQIIDAKGLAVSPGFINMLSWANVSLLHDGRSKSDLFQGVTLEVMGEGTSMGPLNEEMKADMLAGQQDIKYAIPWTSLGEYLTHLEEKGVATNVASFVGNGTLRRHVIGVENRKATQEEMEQMKELTAKAMQQGAIGLSSSLLYAPSSSADTQELIELAKIAAEYDGMYISHIRDEGDQLLESIEELITIAKEADIRSEIYHLKASGERNWGKMDEAIARIEKARSEGLAITADMYNYPASSTGLHVQLPEWIRTDGVEIMIEKLKIESNRKRILQEMTFSTPPERILFVGFKNKELRKYTGKYLSDVSDELGKSPKEALIDLIIEDDSRIQVVYFSMSEENMAKKIRQPWMSFCSDAGSYSPEGLFLNTSTHPRAYGSFARLFAKYVREERIISLEEAIRKLTSLPANTMKIKKRGMLKPGFYADIVIFDPNTIKDMATFENPHQLATGVMHVWVNGSQVIKDGEHTGALPGRFVKGPGAN